MVHHSSSSLPADADYDVLIVGGGLVGVALAAALRESALRIGVIESAPLSLGETPTYDDRTLALAYGSRRIFEGMGVWDAIAARGVAPLQRIHISDRGRFGVTRLHAHDAALEALGYVATFRAVGLSLYESIAARANVTLMAPATVTSVTIEQAHARAQVRAADGERAYTARLIVAADGANSAVRDMLGVEADRQIYEQVAIVSSVTPETAQRDTAYERFTENGPLALLPVDAERYAVVWTVAAAHAETVLGWDDETFRRELQECFGERLGRFTRVGKRQSYPLTLTQVREHVRPRFALIGNAAHAVHPVAGQGFNLGLRDVATLAQVLMEGAAEHADPGDIGQLRRYAEWRARDNRATRALTHALVRIFSNDYLPVTLARNLGLLAVDVFPPIKRRLIRMTSGMAGRLPRLACGLPLRRT